MFCETESIARNDVDFVLCKIKVTDCYTVVVGIQPKRKSNHLDVDTLQLYKLAGDHEQLFSVPSAISFRN